MVASSFYVNENFSLPLLRPNDDITKKFFSRVVSFFYNFFLLSMALQTVQGGKKHREESHKNLSNAQKCRRAIKIIFLLFPLVVVDILQSTPAQPSSASGNWKCFSWWHFSPFFASFHVLKHFHTRIVWSSFETSIFLCVFDGTTNMQPASASVELMGFHRIRQSLFLLIFSDV